MCKVFSLPSAFCKMSYHSTNTKCQVTVSYYSWYKVNEFVLGRFMLVLGVVLGGFGCSRWLATPPHKSSVPVFCPEWDTRKPGLDGACSGCATLRQRWWLGKQIDAPWFMWAANKFHTSSTEQKPPSHLHCIHLQHKGSFKRSQTGTEAWIMLEFEQMPGVPTGIV